MGNQPDGTMDVVVSCLSVAKVSTVNFGALNNSMDIPLCLAILAVEQLLLITTFLMGHRDHSTPIQDSATLEHVEQPISLTTRKEGKF